MRHTSLLLLGPVLVALGLSACGGTPDSASPVFHAPVTASSGEAIMETKPVEQSPVLLSDKPTHPRLDSSLNKMVEQIGSMGTQNIAGSAPVSIGDRVGVTVRLSHHSSSTIEFLESVGAMVANIGADYIETYAPVSALVPLSERDGVLRVETMVPPEPAVPKQ